MYEVVVLTADYEGWWLFDDWRESITASYTFDSYKEMLDKYNSLLQELHNEYSSYKIGKHNITAFFNCCDVKYCADCGDDMQIYHSLIALKNQEIIEVKS